MTFHCDVCIVGSGVAGGVMAQEALNAGLGDVLMVEAGRTAPMRDLRKWTDFVTAGRAPFRDHLYQRHEYANTGRDPFELRNNLLRARGGSTLHWEGWSLRLKPEDFALRTRTGRGIDWPLTYDELERFYVQAERTLQVAGDARDPGHPPRSAPFPLPANEPQEADGPFITAMAELGYSTQHLCIARNTKSIYGMAQCQLTGTCAYCPIGGHFTGDQLIDRLGNRPRFELLTEHSAMRLHVGSDQRANRLDVLDQRTGLMSTVEAKTFILCCGAIESPKVLLASTDSRTPHGIGNRAGHVGAFLMNHAMGAVHGALTVPNPSHVAPELDFTTTISRHFDAEPNQAAGKFIIECDAKPVYATTAAAMQRGDDLAAIEAIFDAPVRYTLIYVLEQPPMAENRVSLGNGTDTLGMPRTSLHYALSEAGAAAARASTERILRQMKCEIVPSDGELVMLSHPMGTCRMSDTDADGVVDRNLRVHDTDNVYVCSTAVFPSGGAVNPTLTLVALAHRLGEHLARA